MIEIKDLLLKFNNALLSEETRIEAVKNVLNDIVGIKIEKKEIKIKNNTVYLNIKSIYKNEIFINKEKLLSELEKKLGSKTPKNIK